MIIDRVRAIWCRELKREYISDDADFFTLGGQSVIMAKIQMMYVKELGVEVPMDQMFLNPTVTSIAKYIESSCVSSARHTTTHESRHDTIVTSTPKR